MFDVNIPLCNYACMSICYSVAKIQIASLCKQTVKRVLLSDSISHVAYRLVISQIVYMLYFLGVDCLGS